MESPIKSAYIIPGIKKGAFEQRDLICIVCDYYGVSHQSINGRSRKRGLVVARQVSMYFLKEFFENSTLEKIGAIFYRDHATVLYSIRTVESLLFSDKRYGERIKELRGIITMAIDERKNEPLKTNTNEVHEQI